jgi:hypothetical protein
MSAVQGKVCRKAGDEELADPLPSNTRLYHTPLVTLYEDAMSPIVWYCTTVCTVSTHIPAEMRGDDFSRIRRPQLPPSNS